METDDSPNFGLIEGYLHCYPLLTADAQYTVYIAARTATTLASEFAILVVDDAVKATSAHRLERYMRETRRDENWVHFPARQIAALEGDNLLNVVEAHCSALALDKTDLLTIVLVC